MLYRFVTDSIHTKKPCSRISLSDVHFLMKNGHFAFELPSLGGLEAMYAVHLRLIGKLVVDFLLLMIELFR